MITESGKISIRLQLENRLYNAILGVDVLNHHGIGGVYFMLQEAPSVLNEIIQRSYDAVKRGVESRDYNQVITS